MFNILKLCVLLVSGLILGLVCRQLHASSLQFFAIMGATLAVQITTALDASRKMPVE